MTSLRSTLARIGALFRRHDRADEDLRAEMEAHLEMAIEENLRRGMRPAEARRQALLKSGGLVQAAESVREQRGLPWIESITADLRFAVRHFRRTPLSTVTMILVLSLGIGTNVVLFTVLNSLLTMPAPGIERDAKLVRIRGTMRVQGQGGELARLFSWLEVQEYAGRTDLFSSVGAYAEQPASVEIGDVTMTSTVIYTTPNYFGMLSVQAALGSAPAGDADVSRLDVSPAAMISYAMWQQQFGGSQDVIGRTVRLNTVPIEIAGVAPPRFLGTDGGSGPTMWVPLSAYPLLQKSVSAAFSSYDSTFLNAAARLRDGVSTETASAVVAGLAERSFTLRQEETAFVAEDAESDARNESASSEVVPMLAGNSRVSGDRLDQLVSGSVAGALALVVLLITCTNVSALMVGLAVARRREIGVRLSLGAPRKRLIRQLLTESVLMALIAAAIGLFVTAAGIRVIGVALEDVQLVVDWRVTAVTCAVAVLTGILFGLSPALHATRVSLGEVLKSSSKAVAETRSRLQRALVVAQITLTQPLLVGLGPHVASSSAPAGQSQAAGSLR